MAFLLIFINTFGMPLRRILLSCSNVGMLDNLNCSVFNFGEIVLLPKVLEAERIQQYRPICLLNISFKIFTKVATIGLNSVAGHVVKPTQMTFMQGRNI